MAEKVSDYYEYLEFKEDYDKAEEIVNIIINNIPSYDVNDPNYELKVFTYIYVQLSTMLKYDEEAAKIKGSLFGFDAEEIYPYKVYPREDIRGLVSGKLICTGFAEVLSYVLHKVNIDSIKVSGVSSTSGHVWNQVKLDGIWYNTDLTADSHRIVAGLKCRDFLVSNEDCTCYKEYDVKEEHNDCNKTVSDEMQEKLINEALTKVIIITKNEEPITLDKEGKPLPKFIGKIIELFKKKEDLGGIRL